MAENHNPVNVGHAIGFAVSTVTKGAALVGSALGLSGLRRTRSGQYSRTPGERPGIEHLPDVEVAPPSGAVTIVVTDYSEDQIEVHEVDDIDAFLNEPVPEWVNVRWVNVSGLHPNTVNKFRSHYEFHTLAAEDVMHVPQRPKVEFFDDHLFIIVRMLQLVDNGGTAADDRDTTTLDAEQVSMFLYDKTLVTFQERVGDVWEPIRERLQVTNSRIRKNRANYLLYALLDAIVDHCFPVLEKYGDVLEDLELDTLENPKPEVLHRTHAVKRELALLRRILWPTREVIDQLYREELGHISDEIRPFLRDVYEHTIQIVEIIESYREIVAGLTDLYMSAISNRMNEVMKVLTIMASLFIPLTFIAGVYGMNFEYMPELHVRWAYPLIWCVFVVVTVVMLFWFRFKGWIGRD
ncbi:MAG TPA: magnesium/cobalt transporter CorA [Pseudomonadales bacterium]|nr:magnesium/cobalt transporter CorA [Pseudomonadales bacterium]